MKLLAVSQINEMFKIVGYHIPLDSLSNLERKNAACSKLNIPNVSSEATCVCFQLIGIFSRSVSDWLQPRALQHGFGRAESEKTEVLQANRFQQGVLLESDSWRPDIKWCEGPGKGGRRGFANKTLCKNLPSQRIVQIFPVFWLPLLLRQTFGCIWRKVLGKSRSRDQHDQLILPKKCTSVIHFSWLLDIFENWIQIVEKVSRALLWSRVWYVQHVQKESRQKMVFMQLPEIFLHPVLHLTERGKVWITPTSIPDRLC